MMRKNLLFSVMVLTFLSGSYLFSSLAVPAQAASTDRIQTFAHEIELLREELCIPGMSVAVLQEQEIVFAGRFGYADLQNEIPATENTSYNIASLTRTFAAAVLMKLVETGKPNLDDEMADILNDTLFSFRFRGNNIRGCQIFARK